MDRVAPGTILRLAPHQWRDGRHTLVLRVERAELVDDESMELAGRRLAEDGTPLDPVGVVVDIYDIPGAVVRYADHRRASR